MGNCQGLPLVANQTSRTKMPSKQDTISPANTRRSTGFQKGVVAVAHEEESFTNGGDPFKFGSAALVNKETARVLRESDLLAATNGAASLVSSQSQSHLDDAANESCSTSSCTYSCNSHNGEAVDYKSLYEASLQRIHELEEQNAEQARQQVEVVAAKELYLRIFHRFPALIWRSRLDKQCDYFNQTWLEWTGRTMEQEFGNGWAESVHKDDFDACLKTYVEAFDKREPFYMEYRLLDKHGEYRWIGDHGTPFSDLDGTFLGYIGSCYDVTEQRNNELKLQKLNATKDKLFSIVAHDLRNPIATFVSLSEFLMEGHSEFDEEEMTEIAEEMHRDSKNTLALLEHLLEWSKAQSDEIAFDPQPILVTKVFQDVISQVDVCAKAKQIDIQTQIQEPCSTTSDSDQDDDDTKSAVIVADKNMLITVLRNLLMNAIKFTSAGGTIQLKAQWDTNTGGSDNVTNPPSVLLTVADSGVGMSQEQIDNLFLLSLSASTTREGTNQEKGSGLGLVICKDFVETRHKGRIWVESSSDGGTEFKVRLPQA